jgi:Holliday junction resolvase
VSYSWREFGREAEFVVASYLRSKGWSIVFSPCSRGPADIVARKDESIWCIQVKASMKSPHIKSEEIERLKKYASSVNGIPVFAAVQPWQNDSKKGASLGSYTIFLYSMDEWKLLQV